MLKPTESPPASWQPRFAASITPGPPPVTTAKPASANAAPVARALSYVGVSSSTRADPKIETAGRSICCTAWKPGEELGRDERDVARERLVRPPQQPAVELAVLRHLQVSLDVRLRHRQPEHRREPEVDDGDGRALPGLEAVVLLVLAARPPALPQVEPAEERR